MHYSIQGINQKALTALWEELSIYVLECLLIHNTRWTILEYHINTNKINHDTQTIRRKQFQQNTNKQYLWNRFSAKTTMLNY